MCGIAGFIDFNKKSSKKLLENMTNVLAHRGPDDCGYSFYETNTAQVGLGHRRLSILDLSSLGHQPMKFNDLEIIYNGEIYNFKEIRSELITLGFEFASDSDTEVIIKSFSCWGDTAVHKFNGMFALAIFDKKNATLKVFRDRAGVKPLYWGWDNDLFIFSSELKSFSEHTDYKKEINLNSLSVYLQYGYIPQPYSIFNNTHKLKAGHYLTIDLITKTINEQQYWNVLDYYNKPKLALSLNDAIEQTETLLTSSFLYRMVSDVPVGIFLSGGYDSSLTAAIIQHNSAQKVSTFTIGFKEKGFDEAPFAKKVANHIGSNHTEYYCTPKDALAIIPHLPNIYDEPFGDSSAIPTILVSQLAKKKVSVSLSADGGDEIFAGYNKYMLLQKYFNNFSKIPFRKEVSKVMKRVNPQHIPYFRNTGNFDTKYFKLANMLGANDTIKMLTYYSEHFTIGEVNKLLLKPTVALSTNFENSNVLINETDTINKMLATDYQTYMVDDILTKIDRATMSVSLEGREPLLDYRIIEFAAQLPSKLKLHNGIDKYILKEITHKYIPKELMDRPKMGFSVPIYTWFKEELNQMFKHYLNKDRLDKEGIFNANEIIKLRDKYLNGDQENIQRLWFILMFEMWYEKWMR